MLPALELVIAVLGGSCEADWRFVGAKGGCRGGAKIAKIEIFWQYVGYVQRCWSRSGK
jgi:hypothetical protein